MLNLIIRNIATIAENSFEKICQTKSYHTSVKVYKNTVSYSSAGCLFMLKNINSKKSSSWHGSLCLKGKATLLSQSLAEVINSFVK